MTKTITVTETAKLVRTALKTSFPGIKFSVRSSSYAGGASIDIHYTDGPTEDAVNAVVHQFQGASFDGMIDLKSYHDTEWQGETVHFGADYVTATRSYSVDFLTKACRFISQREGLPMPMIHVSEYNGTGYLNDNQYIAERQAYLNTLMWREYKHFDAAIIDQLEAIGAIADWMNGLAWHVYSKLLPEIEIEDFDLGTPDEEEQEAAQPVASPASFNPAPFCQAVAMAVVAYIPPFDVCGSWEVDAHFQASRQLEAWQAEHPDVDIFPLIFGYFVDDGIEIEDFDLGEPGPREGEENDDDLHPTHGPLPAWMYEEQEPYALSHAPMQQQREQEQPPIIDTLRAMLAERRDKPGQDMLLRLVQEYEDEGAGNDGLLFAYIKEAAQTLYEIYERVKSEQ